MAGFVDCTKYNKEQQEQDTRIENLEKRGIVHDDTLKGDGIDEKKPLGLNTSAEKDNAIKTDKNGVYVKDLGPQVEKLEEALKNKYDRLGNDLEARIRELNGKLNNLKDIEVALAAAKAEGNYNKIKELEARLQAAKEAQQAGDKGLAEAIEALRKQGLSDDEIRKIIADAIARAGGAGRYITRIDTNQNDGTVTYYYNDGTSVTGKLANLGGVVADQVTIGGNGHDKALAVKISKLPDNKLRVVDDGIYLGEMAVQPFLYVTRNGNDENTGTRENPMRTLQGALNRIPDNYTGHFEIFLKENEEFEIVDLHFKSCYLILQAYGDLVDSKYPTATPNAAYYRGYLAKNYPRPIINVRVRRDDANNRVVRDSITSENIIELRGIRVNLFSKVENDDARLDGNFTGVFSSDVRVMLLGCILDQKTNAVTLTGNGAYRNDVFFRAPSVMWNCSILANPMILVVPTFTTQVIFDSWGYVAGMKDGVQQFEPLVPNDNAEAIKAVSKFWKPSSHVNVNAEYHLTFGISYNHDLFNLHPTEQWGTTR